MESIQALWGIHPARSIQGCWTLDSMHSYHLLCDSGMASTWQSSVTIFGLFQEVSTWYEPNSMIGIWYEHVMDSTRVGIWLGTF